MLLFVWFRVSCCLTECPCVWWSGWQVRVGLVRRKLPRSLWSTSLQWRTWAVNERLKGNSSRVFHSLLTRSDRSQSPNCDNDWLATWSRLSCWIWLAIHTIQQIMLEKRYLHFHYQWPWPLTFRLETSAASYVGQH